MPSSPKRIKTPEVLITIAFAAVMIVMAIPAVGSLRDRGHAKQIIELAEDLGQASLRFQKDCGQGPIEFSVSADGQSYTQPRYHQLSMPQDIRGWNGPYIEEPLSHKHNPFGGPVYLQNHLGSSPANGFALQGVTGPRSEGAGQFVVFHGVPERIAQEIDQALDKKVVRKKHWKKNGRVEWAPGGGGSLSICLLDNKGK